MLARGKSVSPTQLAKIFSDIAHRLNNLGPSSFQKISTGQLFIDSMQTAAAPTKSSIEVLSSSCEQFIDSSQCPTYALYEEMGVVTHSPEDYLKCWRDDIERLEART